MGMAGFENDVRIVVDSRHLADIIGVYECYTFIGQGIFIAVLPKIPAYLVARVALFKT
jgi:hypothetical protein